MFGRSVRLLPPIGLWGPWLVLYLVLLGVVLYGLPGGRSDDAEIMQHTQVWAWGYRLRNPPLFEWFSWAVMHVTGPGVGVVMGLRLACLVAMLGLIYRLGRQLGLPPKGALASALAVALVPQFYYYALFDLTHTVLAGVFYVLLPMTVMRVRAQPSLARAVMVGVVVGLGLLTKHLFALYVLGALLACAWVPAYRVLWRPRWLLIAVLSAMVVVAPYVLWCVAQGVDAFVMQQHESLQTAQTSSADHMGMGLSRLGQMVVTVMLPWVLLWALCLRSPRVLRRVRASEDGRWLSLTLVGTVALIGVTWVVLGAQRAEAHHLMFMALAPVAVMSTCLRVEGVSRRLQTMALLSACFAVLVVPILFVMDSVKTAQRCEQCGPYLDYPDMAQRLRQAGLRDGVLYYATHARSLSVASMRPDLPGVVLVRADVPATESPPLSAVRGGACALIWQAGEDAWWFNAQASRRLPPGLLSAMRAGQVTARWRAPLRYRGRLGQEIAVLVQQKGCS